MESNFVPTTAMGKNISPYMTKWFHYIWYHRVAEVAQEHRWHPLKSLDSDENFEPEHALFCRELRFVEIYALFLEIFGQKSAFLGQNSVSWARSALLHGIYWEFCWAKFAFVTKIINTRLTKICMAIFAPDERPPSSATLAWGKFISSWMNFPHYDGTGTSKL